MKEIRTKVVLGLFLMSAVVVLSLSLYTGVAMNSFSDSLDQSRSERLVAEAASASLIVSGQDLNSFTQPSDMQDDNYAQLVRRLSAFASLHNVKEVFYLRPLPDGNMQYITSNLAQSNTNNLASEPIAATTLTQNAAQGAMAVVNLGEHKASGSNGDLLAYAPVFDQTGKVVAIAGVGVSDDALRTVDAQIKNLTVILLACVAVVILAACANVLLQVRKENELQERVHQQTLMVDISRVLISNQEFEISVKSVLEETATFLGAQRAYLLDVPDGEQTPVLHNSWQSAGTHSSDVNQELQFVLNKVGSTFKQTTNVSFQEHALFCSNTIKDSNGAYSELNDIGIASFAWAPLHIENKLWNVLLIDYLDEPHIWTDNERQLINTVSNDLAGAIARERFNEQREQALDHAVQASETKSEFLSNMSHEMRTPMNAIIGMTTIALGSDDPKRKDYCLGHIKEASSNLLSIINDVLDMSNLQTHSLELVPKPFCLQDAIKEVVDDIAYKIKERSQTFSVNIDDAIPSVLVGDKKRLNQVIGNLLSNANKFTANGGAISLDIKDRGADQNGQSIYFAVTDNGIGISPALQKNLFASFEQVESGSSRKYGGVGLGLAISRRIIELMNGHIELESVPDKGSTFYFTISLPKGSKDDLEPAVAKMAADKLATDKLVEPESNDTEPPHTISADEDVEHINLSNYRILLAEDIDINREVVFALLENSGIKIDIATSGLEALQSVTDKVDAYDLIFMDLQMPDMDGLDATRRIRALPQPKAQALPIIAMTANVFQEDIDQCLKAGMNDHIGKPINLKEIYSMLLKYLPDK